MIRLYKEGMVREVASEEAAAQWLEQDYVRLEGPEGLSLPAAEGGEKPLNKTVLMNMKKDDLMALAKDKGLLASETDTKATIADAILAAAEHPAEE